MSAPNPTPLRVKAIYWLHVFAPRRFVRWHVGRLDVDTFARLYAYTCGPDREVQS